MVRRRIVVGRNSIDIIDFGLGKSSIFPLPRLPAFFRSQGSFPIVNVNEPINEEREEGGKGALLEVGGARNWPESRPAGEESAIWFSLLAGYAQLSSV